MGTGTVAAAFLPLPNQLALRASPHFPPTLRVVLLPPLMPSIVIPPAAKCHRPPVSSMPLDIDNRCLRKLERFEIVPRGMYRGGQLGHRRSPSRGVGLEFADHKEYSAGDDIRYLDWNLYAQLEELFVKIFEQEEAVPMYILLDGSASMSRGGAVEGPAGRCSWPSLAYVGPGESGPPCGVSALRRRAWRPRRRRLPAKTRMYEVAEFLPRRRQAAPTCGRRSRRSPPRPAWPACSLLSPISSTAACSRGAPPGRAEVRPVRLAPRGREELQLDSPATWSCTTWKPAARSASRCGATRSSAIWAFFRAHCDQLAASCGITACGPAADESRSCWTKFCSPCCLGKECSDRRHR